MRKSLINILPLIAGAIALSACSEKMSPIEEDSNDGAQLMTITASQEGDDTRAAIDATVSTKIDWSAGDKINYFGAGSSQYMTLDGEGGNSCCYFSGTISPFADGSNYVLYPYNSTATCNRNTGNIATTVPAVQHVPAGSFDPECAIMVGKVVDSKVEFKNAVGYLAFVMPKVEFDEKITKMIITGNDNEYLWGDVSVQGITADAAPATITWKNGGNKYKYIEVVPSGSDHFETGKTYYVAVYPNASLSKGIYVLLYNGTTTDPKNLKLLVRKTTKDIGMARNKVKKSKMEAIARSEWYSMIELDSSDGTGKVYMSPYNLGAISPIEGYIAWASDVTPKYQYNSYKYTFGNYYAWGEIDTKSEYTEDNYTIKSLSSFKDAATANWGPDWRMPLPAEIEKNTTNSHIRLLPACGYINGTEHVGGAAEYLWNSNGFYWTAYDEWYRQYFTSTISLESHDEVYEFYGAPVNLHRIGSSNFTGYEGMNITPVLK